MAHLLDVLGLLIWPLAACLCIGLLHAYAGLHVLRRGIIFVDLALAQMAALGAVVGMQFTHHPDHHDRPATLAAVTAPKGPSPVDELDQAIQQSGQTAAAFGDDDDESPASGILEFWPTIFALGGAVLLSFSRVGGDRVPHEAIIGIVYVVAAAATVLILSKSPHAHEQMEEMLTGRLLFIDRKGVLGTAALYAGLGLLHWIFRRPFLTISASPEAAEKSGMRVRLWDCLFYAMFALMVTRSVAIGGVLVVFSFLIIPGVRASLLVVGLRAKILIAWLIVAVISVAGLSFSAIGDLPSGSTLVATFGAALLLCLPLSALIRRSARQRGLFVTSNSQGD